ncbi:hypothetical protein NDJ26_07975 [Vibrio parahaemolyticus]|nr:hypothetical protein [Vibrio parahaemolyticus]MCS0091855.1 hypothetical protein [Vibrio parahaemolyticus]
MELVAIEQKIDFFRELNSCSLLNSSAN